MKNKNNEDIIGFIKTASPEAYGEIMSGRLNIIVQDDSDGKGQFLSKWDSVIPIPKGLEVYKPKKQ